MDLVFRSLALVIYEMRDPFRIFTLWLTIDPNPTGAVARATTAYTSRTRAASNRAIHRWPFLHVQSPCIDGLHWQAQTLYPWQRSQLCVADVMFWCIFMKLNLYSIVTGSEFRLVFTHTTLTIDTGHDIYSFTPCSLCRIAKERL